MSAIHSDYDSQLLIWYPSGAYIQKNFTHWLFRDEHNDRAQPDPHAVGVAGRVWEGRLSALPPRKFLHIGSKIVQAERYFNSSLSCWVLSENNSIAVEDYGKNAPVIKHPFEKKLTLMGFEPTTILLTVFIRRTLYTLSYSATHGNPWAVSANIRHCPNSLIIYTPWYL